MPLAALVLAMSAAPALAQPPTTPVPTQTDPNSPPMSAPVGPVPPGHAVGDAGTGLGIVRILPNSAPTKAIVPDVAGKLPKQSAAELGMGLASAQVNSEAFLAFEHSVAQAAPGGLAVLGSSPQAPGALSQTASPDNPQPVHGGLQLPSSPLDALITVRGLQGQVHARWSDTLGPCVGTISDASTEIASVSLLNVIPTLPSTPDLTGVFDAPALDANGDKAVIDGLKQLTGPLSTLGGVLSGGSKPKADGSGSLVSLPNTLSARSTVRLVDIPGSANKAVQSTSTLQVAALKLLAGTPFEIQIKVVSQPTLQVTSTGDEKTSTVRYTAPVLEVVQGGKSLGVLDAAHPKLDIPIGIPLGLPGADQLPIIGDLLANGQKVADAVSQGLQKLDLGVIRLGVAQLDQRGTAMTSPFAGYQAGATARMLDLQVLPTQALGLPNLPTALAQVSLGEQIARAYAPTGGVMCRTSGQPAPPPAPMPQGKAPGPLAYTTMAYHAVPMFWAGTAMLLVGVVLVAALPTLRTPRRGFAAAGPRLTDPPEDADTDPPAGSADAADHADAAVADADDTETATDAEAVAADAVDPDAAVDIKAVDTEAANTEAADTAAVDAAAESAEPVEDAAADLATAADAKALEPTDAAAEVEAAEPLNAGAEAEAAKPADAAAEVEAAEQSDAGTEVEAAEQSDADAGGASADAGDDVVAESDAEGDAGSK
jgi:hypothetical protein